MATLIVNSFNDIVKSTIEEYSKKYECLDIQLFMVNIKGVLDIQVLCQYKVRETIHVDNLKISFLVRSLISNNAIEGKILNSLENFKPECQNPKAMLFINKSGNVIAFLYDAEKPLRQIDISKII